MKPFMVDELLFINYKGASKYAFPEATIGTKWFYNSSLINLFLKKRNQYFLYLIVHFVTPNHKGSH